MNEVANQVAGQLAGQDDRYLMIYAVVLLIAGGSAIIYKLSKFLEKMVDKQSSQTEQLIQVVERSNILTERATTTMDRASAAMENNTRFIEKMATAHH